MRREEEQRERWNVSLMESDSHRGGRDNNAGKTPGCSTQRTPAHTHTNTHIHVFSFGP